MINKSTFVTYLTWSLKSVILISDEKVCFCDFLIGVFLLVLEKRDLVLACCSSDACGGGQTCAIFPWGVVTIRMLVKEFA